MMARRPVLAVQVATPVEVKTAVTVGGRGVDAQTGEPIAKATVSIPASKIEAATDGAGVLVLPDAPRGDVETQDAVSGSGSTPLRAINTTGIARPAGDAWRLAMSPTRAKAPARSAGD
jgi:hypothetical protein